MKAPDEKPYQVEQEETNIKPSRSAELREVIEDYVRDLRQIIQKLRNKLN